MNVVHAQHGDRRLGRFFEAVRANPLTLLITAYVVILAVYASIFYVFATSAPLRSLGGLLVNAKSHQVVDAEPLAPLTQGIVKNPSARTSSDDTTESSAPASTKKETSHTKVYVNGTPIATPKNGSTHTVIRDESRNGNVQVSITARSTNTTDASSSTTVTVQSSTSVEEGD